MIAALALAAVLVALAGPGSARAASATLKADSTRATEGAAITVTVTVSGAKSVGKVRFPEMPNFDVLSGGKTIRSGWVNGRAVAQVLLTFYVYPKKTGEYIIGPVGVDADGRTVWTSSVTVMVSEAKRRKPTEDHFVDAWIEPERPYAGQPVVYHLQFGFSASIKGFQRDDPDWGGLVKEATVEEEVLDRLEIIDGKTFRILEWKIPLFTLRPGSYEVAAATVHFDQVVGYQRRTQPLFNDPVFDQFFSTAKIEPVTLEAEPVTVEVLALPAAGQPEDFSGLVGAARLQGELSRNRCKVGESVSLALVLQGNGNVQDVDLELVVPEGIKVYSEDADLRFAWGQTGPYGTVSRTFDLVPVIAGEAIIPAVRVSYFEPERKRYRDTEVGPFRLTIEPGEEGEGHGSHDAELLIGEEAIQLLTAEPYPAVETGGYARRATGGRFGLLGLLLVTPLGGAGAAALLRRVQRRRADPERRRRLRARKLARKALDRAEEQTTDRAGAMSTAEEALRRFLAERSAVPTGAMTPEELGAAVDAAGAPDTAQEVIRWMSDMGAIRYAGRTTPSTPEMVERARELLEELDGELP